MITVIIADDQALLRKSLGQIIGSQKELNVIRQVENGKEAAEQCKLLNPNIVMLDIEMPVMNGIEALKLIKKQAPDVRTIILTTFDVPEQISAAFIAGADGYISKDISPEELIMTIKCVNAGLTVVGDSVKQLMVESLTQETPTGCAGFEVLVAEEIKIVELIVEGKSNKQIATLLNYSEGTIKNKVSKIYGKLGISDRIQLAVCALENGIS